MKITKIIQYTLLTYTVLNTAAWAYSPDKEEEECKKPHFRDFSLPVYVAPENKEVSPESEFTIMMSPWTDPKTIKLTAKEKKINFALESNDSFHRLTAKLPAEFSGHFVRLNLSAKAVTGCEGKDGWLLKVSAPAQTAQPVAGQPNTDTTPAPPATAQSSENLPQPAAEQPK